MCFAGPAKAFIIIVVVIDLAIILVDTAYCRRKAQQDTTGEVSSSRKVNLIRRDIDLFLHPRPFSLERRSNRDGVESSWLANVSQVLVQPVLVARMFFPNSISILRILPACLLDLMHILMHISVFLLTAPSNSMDGLGMVNDDGPSGISVVFLLPPQFFKYQVFLVVRTRLISAGNLGQYGFDSGATGICPM